MKSRLLIILTLFLLTGFTPENGSDLDFQIYPNPVTDDAMIINAENDFHRIDILNIVGQVVHTEEMEPSNNIRLNINLQPGIYFVRLTFAARSSNIKRIWVN
jgi:hypothetical protein